MNSIMSRRVTYYHVTRAVDGDVYGTPSVGCACAGRARACAGPETLIAAAHDGGSDLDGVRPGDVIEVEIDGAGNVSVVVDP